MTATGRRAVAVAAVVGTALAAAVLVRRLIRTLRALGQPLEEAVCLVTGDLDGNALVIARHLLWRGARVAVCGLGASDPETADLERVAATLGAGRDTVVIGCRPHDRSSVLAMLEVVSGSLGRVEVLVSTAPSGLIPELVGDGVLMVTATAGGRSGREPAARRLVDSIEARRGGAGWGGGGLFQPHRPSL